MAALAARAALNYNVGGYAGWLVGLLVGPVEHEQICEVCYMRIANKKSLAHKKRSANEKRRSDKVRCFFIR